ncbi:MAG: FeoB small GTPase domain-containing protein [Desulfobacterales bacterium]
MAPTKEGTYVRDGFRLHIVDLPGTYSLTAYSLEEVVARDYLVEKKPEVVINIVDASNLERNLYLAIQFLEMGIPICIALNMIDVAKKRGIKVDVQKLSSLLGVPVTPTVARAGKGKKELMDSASQIAREHRQFTSLKISYGADIDPVLSEMENEIADRDFLTDTYQARWIALKYLEGDEQIISKGQKVDLDLSTTATGCTARIESIKC